jgi:hypothetical protein
MGLSLAQRFGTGATLDVTIPAAPKLIIDLSDLENTATGGDITNSQGLNDVGTITALTKDVNADKIAAALLVLWKQKQPTTDEDNTIGIYIGDPYKQFATRNSVDQLGFIYQTTVYIADPTAALDPDDVVTA